MDTATDVAQRTLQEELQERQGELSDRAFARKLGVPHDLWIGYKAGRRELGKTVLEQIALVFPELAPGPLGEYLRSHAREPQHTDAPAA